MAKRKKSEQRPQRQHKKATASEVLGVRHL